MLWNVRGPEPGLHLPSLLFPIVLLCALLSRMAGRVLFVLVVDMGLLTVAGRCSLCSQASATPMASRLPALVGFVWHAAATCIPAPVGLVAHIDRRA